MLLDISGLLCPLDQREPLHAMAVSCYMDAKRRISHGFVIAELVALANA